MSLLEDSEHPMRHLTASMVVLNDANEVLLIHHKASNAWQFPGGHLDPGEDPAAAAIREVFEETGIQARIVCQQPLDLPGTTWLPSPWMTCQMPAPAKPDRGPGEPVEPAHMHVDMLFVGVASSDAEIVTAEAEVHAVRWVPLDQLHALDVRADVPQVAQLAKTYYAGWVTATPLAPEDVSFSARR